MDRSLEVFLFLLQRFRSPTSITNTSGVPPTWSFSPICLAFLITFQDNHTPILIGCPYHGIFRMKPRDHLQRRMGCPKCGRTIPGSVDGSAAAVLKRSQKATVLGQHLLQSYGLADEIAKLAVRAFDG